MEEASTSGHILFGSIYYEMPRTSKSKETESRLVVARAGDGDWGQWEVNIHKTGFLFSVLKIDDDDGCTTLWTYETPLYSTF